MEQAEEELLVLAVQDGDQEAFKQLYLCYHKPLGRFAYKLCGSTELAQDALQDSWLKASHSIRKIRDPRTFRSWIYRLVRWRCLDLMRQHSKEKLYEYFNESVHKDLTSSELDKAIEQSDELNTAMAKMPAMEKQIIHLFYLDELTIAEIGTILSIPEGTVKSRLSRVRTLLREKFEV